MSLTRVSRLPPQDAERLDRDGYLLLHGAVPAAWIEPLRAAFDAGELANDQWPVPRGWGWRHALVDLDPTVQQVCRLLPVLAAVGRLLGGPFFLTQVEGREPLLDGRAQGLHRDGGHDRTPSQFVSALVFIDPFGPDNGATEVAPGTHRGEGLTSPAGVPHPDAMVLTGESGDILLFDANVLHGATSNVSGARRRSLLATYAVQAQQAEHRETRQLRSVRMDTEMLFALEDDDGSASVS